MEKKEISYGSIAEVRAHNLRKEGRPPMDLVAMNQAFEKADPGGKIAQRLADRYNSKGLKA